MAPSDLPWRTAVSPRFELFFALAATLRPIEVENATVAARWLGQTRRKFDQGMRRRMGALALAPAIWPILAAAPGMAALEDGADAVIAALDAMPPETLAQHCLRGLSPGDLALQEIRRRLREDAAGQHHAAVEALRRFDRLAFAALWRQIRPGLEEGAAAGRDSIRPGDWRGAETADETVFMPSVFAPHGYRLLFETEAGRRISVVLFQVASTAPPSEPPTETVRGSSASNPELIFQALGDATRFAVARLIARDPMTSAELARRLGVSKPTMAHHLRRLRDARLVIEERHGNSIMLSLDRRTIASLSGAAMTTLFDARPVTIRRSRRR